MNNRPVSDKKNSFEKKIQVVSFNCVLKNKFGKILSSSFNNDVLTVESGQTQEIKGLTEALQSMSQGEKRLISLNAKDAYGFYDPEKVVTFARKHLPQIKFGKKPIEPVRLNINGKIKSYTVLELSDDQVVLDGNHPFAGQDLIFEIETVQVRPATLQELNQASLTRTSSLLH